MLNYSGNNYHVTVLLTIINYQILSLSDRKILKHFHTLTISYYASQKTNYPKHQSR